MAYEWRLETLAWSTWELIWTWKFLDFCELGWLDGWVEQFCKSWSEGPFLPTSMYITKAFSPILISSDVATMPVGCTLHTVLGEAVIEASLRWWKVCCIEAMESWFRLSFRWDSPVGAVHPSLTDLGDQQKRNPVWFLYFMVWNNCYLILSFTTWREGRTAIFKW